MAAITTANGVNMTNRAVLNANTGSLSNFMDGANQVGTKLRVCYDNYEFDGDTMAAAGVITIGRVPKGGRVLGFYVGNTANSAATTADLQLVDPAGNITTATASEAWTSWNGANQQFIPALRAVAAVAQDDEHTVTVTTAAQTVADGTDITVATLYILED
ncbi:hypothetical protein LCGC14_0659750 [marine sediment metagenome]|uniref:Uncharacterized protein n=1 Tax=marine sediment metagenome TaxID=412755 RepID=A0A0F9TFC4_9ZZZZ